MPDLYGVAAYGRTQSLSREECQAIWDDYLHWRIPLDTVADLDAVILAVKQARRPAPMPKAHTHEQWTSERQGGQ